MIQPVIKKESVRLASEPSARETLASSDASAPHGKRVRLLRVDGVVRALELSCTCGETSVVELEYSNPPENPR